MQKIKFQCSVSNSDPTCPLSIEIWLDDHRIYHNEWVKETTTFEHLLTDEDGEHELRWVMNGKLREHTKIDENHAILKDAVLTIDNIKFDDIVIDFVAYKKSTYSHDFNGTKDPVQDNFFGTMGCNGTVNLKFTTPCYLWLLENM